MNWRQKLTSRRFWMAVASAILLVANEGLGLNLPTDTILAFVAVVLGYILGESYTDAHRQP